MFIGDNVLKNDEKAVFSLRSLYQSYGYTHFKMSKFEEYELYAKNKNFLVSENIITFTNAMGKLMALKPDVTLSIVKNSRDTAGDLLKVYYNENVYRMSKDNYDYKEIMQVGLECIGEIDKYRICEVIILALESLSLIAEDYVLDISHVGLVSALIDRLELSEASRSELLVCIGEKNQHGINDICLREKADKQNTELLKLLVNTYGKPSEVIKKLNDILPDDNVKKYLYELSDIVSSIDGTVPVDKIRIDFSVINDMNYYNGIVFKGFASGIPASVLSGGQYDNHMHRMGKKSGAIGFAVYLDLLDELSVRQGEFDVDAVLLYDEKTDVAALNRTVRAFTEKGISVSAQRTVPQKLRYRRLMRMNGTEAEIADDNA